MTWREYSSEAQRLKFQSRKAVAGALQLLLSDCQDDGGELVRMYLSDSVASGWTVVEAYAALTASCFEMLVWSMSDDDEDRLYSLILEYAAHE